ncbi:MAG: hypothetical protein JNL53_17045, partial [Cyclobacteriaceae bacterium]|nr:hypothetical protein [Cyclobacteriaceae bacterium]
TQGQQAQQLQMSDFVLFSGAGGPGTSSCNSPGNSVQIASSSTVTGGSVGSLVLVKTTGPVTITGTVHSKGTISLANSNCVTGDITASNSSTTSGTVLLAGSNSALGGNIDVKGKIVVSGGVVSGRITQPAGASYSGPSPQGGRVIGSPNLPIFPTLPQIINFPPFPQMPDITSTRVITPGGYDDIKLSGNQTLTFKGTGIYILDKIENKNSNNFIFDFENDPTGTIKIYVHNNVSLGKLGVTAINGGSASRIFTEVHGKGLGSSNYAFDIANGSTSSKSRWLGTVWAPFASINIGSGTGKTDVTGALWSGVQVNVQSGVSIVYEPFLTCTTPTVNAGSDKVITCAVTSLQLNGSSTTPGVSYAWVASNGGNITAGANTATPTVNASGTYTLTVTIGTCTASDIALVTLNNTPPLVNAGPDISVCAEDNTVTLTASITGGTGSYNYSWDNGMTGASITVSPTATKIYTVTATSLGTDNCSASDAVTVNVNAPLSVNAGPDISVCSNANNATLTALATGGTSPYTYEWFANGSSLGTQATINVTPSTTTEYTIIIKDSFSTQSGACAASDKIVVTVNQAQSFDVCAPTGGKVDDTKIIGGELTELYKNTQQGATVTTNEIFYISGQTVLVEIIIFANTDLVQLQSILSALNFETDDDISDLDASLIITGFIPFEYLDDLNTYPDLINFVRPAIPPIGNAITTPGDQVMRSNWSRAGYDLSGQGIKIAVLSDSYDTKEGAAADNIINGELPNVTVVKELPSRYGQGSDEGRAMLQIVHDVAPGAELYFRTGFITAGDFAKGIRDLKTNQNCDIIVDDITYITEPFYTDGRIAQAVNDVKTQGVTYFTAAGNFGNKSYEATFNPFPGKQAHAFSGTDTLQSITVGPGNYTIVLQWDDPVYSIGSRGEILTGTENDLDIYLTNFQNAPLFGFNRNNLGGDPIEILNFSVPTGTTINTDIMIVRATGNTNVKFKYIIFRGDKITVNEYFSGAPTIVGQANANGAITVGAVLYNNTRNSSGYDFPPVPEGVEPFTPATFSSRGGITNGLNRNKPDFIAPNGVNTTVDLAGKDANGKFINDLENDDVPNFFGTSAAAPHAAGVAALVMEA